MAHPASADDENVFSFLSPLPHWFCCGLAEDGDGAGPLDDEGHDGHLVVGGLVVAAGGGGDGLLLQGSLQESVAKCTDSQ